MSYISLTPSTNTLFAPSEKSIVLSQNKQEFKRKPLFHCSCSPLLTHLLLDLWALTHQSPILRRKRWLVLSQAPSLLELSNANPQGSQLHCRGRPLSGSPLCAVWYPANDHFHSLPFCFLESTPGYPGRDRTLTDVPLDHTLLKQPDKKWTCTLLSCR